MDLIIPTLSRSSSLYASINAEIWIAGQRRLDARVRELSISAGTDIGTCKIEFRPAQDEPAYARFDASLCFENDPVEIRVNPVGTIWRGTITGRESDSTSVSYMATDLIGKMNNTCWPHEYNYRDDVTQERKYAYTARQIAADAYAFYAAWKALYLDGDAALTIDLESFPLTVPNETAIEGQGLLDGLRQMMESIDYRWRVGVEHTSAGSIVRAFAIGVTTRRRVIRRGLDPSRAIHQQPGGQANVASISKSVSSAGVVSHIYADGAPRLIESALPLTQNWNFMEDNDPVPEGHVLAEYVTASEQALVINEWEKYTAETLDEKVADDISKAAKVRNPNYRKKYEKVCREFALPTINDWYYFNDDQEHYPTLLGETARHPRIDSELIQTNPSGDLEVENDSAMNGLEHGPFIVYKRTGDDNLYYTFDGFSIRKNKLVEFSRPFVDSVTTILASGSKGTGGAYNEGAKTSVYDIADAGIDLTELVSEAQVTAGCWLVLGDYSLCLQIQSRTASAMTVLGNTSGAGGTSEAGAWQPGAGWAVVGYDPRVAKSASGGTGAADGKYALTLDTAVAENELAGYYLVLAGWDASGVPTLAPASTFMYRITSHGTGTEITITTDRTNETLVGKPAEWAIVKLVSQTYRPYEWVKLNCAWESRQRLGFFSGDLASGIKNKRRVTRRNDDYKWLSEVGNYRLVRSTTDGQEDKFTLTLNEVATDRRKDLAALTAWTIQQLAGTNAVQTRITATLCPIDWTARVGDRLVDTTADSGATITGLQYDLERNTLTIGAANRD